MNKIVKNTLFISLSFLLLLGILIFGILWSYSNNIPDYRFLKSYKPPVSSKVYSGNGELVADFSKEKRIFVPFNSIPKNVIYSFLSAEDKNFFSHPGVDAKGVLRAVINNISNIISSKRLEGASTITQQVAKNFLLTNEVSLNRKIKEAILAFRIERALSKQRILELYLNQIYLGSGAYGVASASLEYFDKSIQDLDYGNSCPSPASSQGLWRLCRARPQSPKLLRRPTLWSAPTPFQPHCHPPLRAHPLRSFPQASTPYQRGQQR